MRRKLLIILAVLSILPAAVATLFWIRSYRASDYISFTTSTHSTSPKLLAGDIIWTRIEMPIPSPAGWELQTGGAVRPEKEIIYQHGLVQRDSLFYRYTDVTPTSNAFRIETAAVPFWWWDILLILPALGASVLVATTHLKTLKDATAGSNGEAATA
jgi:hypothetical protein